MKYFITVNSIIVANNLTKDEAISIAINKNKKIESTLNIGIGKYKYKNGKRVYTCLPLHFFL
jgi:hypothetical protein